MLENGIVQFYMTLLGFASVKICHEKDVGFQIFNRWLYQGSGHIRPQSWLKLRPWRPWPVLFGLAMQIFVKTLTGTTITLTVQPDTKIDPSLNFDRFTLSGNHGITLAKILGEASQVVEDDEDVVSAAEKMLEFWKSSEGLAVKQYVEEKVIRPRDSSGSPDGFHRVRMDSDELVASVDELLIEVSRFFILKAVNRDTAAPAAKPKEVTVASDSETGDEAQLSQSQVDHMASDSESDEEAALSPSLEVEAQTGKAQSHEGTQLSPRLKVDQEMANDAGTCDEEAAPSPSLEELSPSWEVDQVMASDTPQCDEEAPLSVSLEVDQAHTAGWWVRSVTVDMLLQQLVLSEHGCQTCPRNA